MSFLDSLEDIITTSFDSVTSIGFALENAEKISEMLNNSNFIGLKFDDLQKHIAEIIIKIREAADHAQKNNELIKNMEKKLK